MGNFCEFEETLPPEIMTMTKDTRKLKFEILYCEGQGSRRQADYAQRIIQEIFPKSKIKLLIRPLDERIVVNVNGVKVYDSILEGYLFEETAENFAKSLLERA